MDIFVQTSNDMSILKGKVALVTGGSRGIGEAIVLQFAQQGADIAFTYVSSAEKANAVAVKAEAYGIRAVAIQSDAADFQQAEGLINEVIDKLGRLDILVNNAGIILFSTVLFKK